MHRSTSLFYEPIPTGNTLDYPTRIFHNRHNIRFCYWSLHRVRSRRRYHQPSTPKRMIPGIVTISILLVMFWFWFAIEDLAISQNLTKTEYLGRLINQIGRTFKEPLTLFFVCLFGIMLLIVIAADFLRKKME